MKCAMGTPHVHLDGDTTSNIETMHQQLMNNFYRFCPEIFPLAMTMASTSKIKWCTCGFVLGCFFCYTVEQLN